MCLGIPMQIIRVDGIAAEVTDGTQSHLVDLSLTPGVQAGDWVLTFLGAAREVLSEDEARKITAALGGLQSLMNGGELGDAFADLEARDPALPPHLQAAHDAGKSTA